MPTLNLSTCKNGNTLRQMQDKDRIRGGYGCNCQERPRNDLEPMCCVRHQEGWVGPSEEGPHSTKGGTSRKPSPKPPHTEHHLPVVTTTGIEKASFARDVSSRRTSRRHAAARRTPRPRRAGGGGRLLLLRRREVCRDKRVDRWQNMHENRASAHTHTHTHTHTLAVEHEKREDRPPPQPRGMYLFSICEKRDTKNKWFDKRRCHGTWVTPTEGARRNSKNKERLNNRKRH